MELEIRLALLRFVCSIITMLLAVYVSPDMTDLLMPSEEKDQRDDALAVVHELQDRFPILKSTSLNSYETMAAGGLVRPVTGFDAIGGHRDIKKELLLHVVVPLKNPDVFFASPGMRPPSGVLLHGPPGTGKSMLARGMASECELPFLMVKSSLVEQKYFGESEKIVKAIFTLAEKIQPCIIFIDEIDSMLRNRSELEHSATYSVKTQFLQEMDRIENENLRVVIMAATNNPQSLDKALYRRLPRSYKVGKPDQEARLEILNKLMETERPLPSELLSWIVEETANFSGSDLKDTFKAAAALRNETFAQLILTHGHVNATPGGLLKHHWEAAIRKTQQVPSVAR